MTHFTINNVQIKAPPRMKRVRGRAREGDMLFYWLHDGPHWLKIYKDCAWIGLLPDRKFALFRSKK